MRAGAAVNPDLWVGSIQVLHRVEELGYSHRIIDGVMMGFDPWHAKELLEQNKCKEEDFKFFYRYTRWVRGQLEVGTRRARLGAAHSIAGGGEGGKVVHRSRQLRPHLPKVFEGEHLVLSCGSDRIVGGGASVEGGVGADGRKVLSHLQSCLQRAVKLHACCDVNK